MADTATIQDNIAAQNGAGNLSWKIPGAFPGDDRIRIDDVYLNSSKKTAALENGIPLKVKSGDVIEFQGPDVGLFAKADFNHKEVFFTKRNNANTIISFTVPDLSESTGDGKSFFLKLISSAQPSISQAVSPAIIYSYKQDKEEDDKKSKDKKTTAVDEEVISERQRAAGGNASPFQVSPVSTILNQAPAARFANVANRAVNVQTSGQADSIYDDDDSSVVQTEVSSDATQQAEISTSGSANSSVQQSVVNSQTQTSSVSVSGSSQSEVETKISGTEEISAQGKINNQIEADVKTAQSASLAGESDAVLGAPAAPTNISANISENLSEPASQQSPAQGQGSLQQSAKVNATANAGASGGARAPKQPLGSAQAPGASGEKVGALAATAQSGAPAKSEGQAGTSGRPETPGASIPVSPSTASKSPEAQASPEAALPQTQSQTSPESSTVQPKANAANGKSQNQQAVKTPSAQSQSAVGKSSGKTSGTGGPAGDAKTKPPAGVQEMLNKIKGNQPIADKLGAVENNKDKAAGGVAGKEPIATSKQSNLAGGSKDGLPPVMGKQTEGLPGKQPASQPEENSSDSLGKQASALQPEVGVEKPEEVPEGQSDDEPEDESRQDLPINNQAAGSATPKSSEALSEATQEAVVLANKFINNFLLEGVWLVWVFALPSFGLSVILGAILGDFLWLFKNTLLNYAVRAVNLPLLKGDLLKNELENIKDKIKFGLAIKINVVLMNLTIIVVGIIVLIFSLTLTKALCDNLITGNAAYLAGYGDVCKSINNLVGTSTNGNGSAPVNPNFAPANSAPSGVVPRP